jgi:hypothetical protein
MITSTSNLTGLRNAATALGNHQEFQRGQLNELASTGFEPWAKESFDIATKFAYRNDGRIVTPKAESMDCTMVATAPVLPAGYEIRPTKVLHQLRRWSSKPRLASTWSTCWRPSGKSIAHCIS